MSEKNKTPEMPSASDYPLPKVTKEVTDSLVADVQEQGIKLVMRQATERLSTNNPELYASVGTFAGGMFGPDISPGAMQAIHNVMVMTHELMRRQAETDVLESMIAPPEEML